MCILYLCFGETIIGIKLIKCQLLRRCWFAWSPGTLWNWYLRNIVRSICMHNRCIFIGAFDARLFSCFTSASCLSTVLVLKLVVTLKIQLYFPLFLTGWSAQIISAHLLWPSFYYHFLKAVLYLPKLLM